MAINKFLEFMISYERLAEDSSIELRTPRAGLNLYPEYWKKSIGKAAKVMFKYLNYDFILKFDTNRAYLTHERMFPIFISYIMPMNKTAGVKIFWHFILPRLFLFVIPFLYLVVYRLMIKTILIRCLIKGLLCSCFFKSEEA